MSILQQKNLRALSPRSSLKLAQTYKSRLDSGFGIVESIASALLLSVLIALGLTLSTMLENTKYESSIRDAARQTIEDDIEKVKNLLFALDYVPATASQGPGGTPQGACYKSNSACTRSGALNIKQVCRDYANRAIQMIPGRQNVVLELSSRNVSAFGGKPFVIRRRLSVGTPNISGNLSVDRSVIKGTYLLENTTNRKFGLSSNTAGEVLRSIDFYPGAHPYCNPE